MDEAELWKRGASARLSGASITQGLKELGIGRYDHDERAVFKSGWVAMEQFLILSRMTGTLTATRVAPD